MNTSPARLGYIKSDFIRLLRAGSEYFDLLEQVIAEATHSIHLQTYIFEYDDTGERIAKALIQAARKGVKVFMVVDGYASQELPSRFISTLRESGIYFNFFNPLLKSKQFYFGRRLHHKIVVVDGKKSLVGGINISNNYNDTTRNVAWLDWALYAEGNISRSLQRVCEARLRKSFVRAMYRTVSPPDHFSTSENAYWVRPRINDWIRRKREVTRSYLEMLSKARSQVMIISSYFLPGRIMRRHLREATKRGVTVKVIVAGISDVILAKYAERYRYRWLLRNNIEVYEYQRKVLHAKLAVYDSTWVTIGSYNVNNMSAYASVELNIDVLNSGFALDMEARLDRIIQLECTRISKDFYESQNFWNRFLQRMAHYVYRVGLFLFTFYVKEKE